MIKAIYDSEIDSKVVNGSLNKQFQGVSMLFKVSYIVCYFLNPSTFMLAIALMGKIALPKVRGTLFALLGLFGSVFIVIMQEIGGATIVKDATIVFWAGASFNLVAFLLILVFALLGKLKH